ACRRSWAMTGRRLWLLSGVHAVLGAGERPLRIGLGAKRHRPAELSPHPAGHEPAAGGSRSRPAAVRLRVRVIRASSAAACRIASAYRVAQPYFLYQQVTGMADNLAQA